MPFYKQEHPYSCAVACLRILLAHYGIEVSEGELREKCKTRELGTYARDILACAQEYGFSAKLEHLSVEYLKELLDQDIHPIVYINMFPTSHIPYSHTVIVESYEGDRLLIVDPNAEPTEIRLSDFLECWEIYDNMAIVIESRKV